MSSEKLTLIEFDGLTGQQKIRNLTSEEILEMEQIRIESEKIKLENKARQDARESALSKLAALGITEEEINAL
jgi:hypothetical protein